MKSLQKRALQIMEHNCEAKVVSGSMNSLLALRKDLEEKIEQHEKHLVSLINDHQELTEDMKVLSNSIQRLDNALGIDFRVVESGPQELKTAAETAEVFRIIMLFLFNICLVSEVNLPDSEKLNLSN